MLDQENYPYFYDKWLTADEWLKCFRTAKERIVGRVKISESPYFQGLKSSEEDLVVWERDSIVLKGYLSVIIAPTRTVRMLFKC